MAEALQGHGGLLLGALIGGVVVYFIDHLGKRGGGGRYHPPWHRGMNMCGHPAHQSYRDEDPNVSSIGPDEDFELSLGENGGRKTHYVADGGGLQANVGYLPGDRLPFNDYLDDRWIGSEVWDRRTSVYKNDGVLYNTVGAVFTEPTTEFHPERRLGIAGAYTSGLEDGPRPRQQHAGGHFPQCLLTGSESNC
jgi:hypothetical protein